MSKKKAWFPVIPHSTREKRCDSNKLSHHVSPSHVMVCHHTIALQANLKWYTYHGTDQCFVFALEVHYGSGTFWECFGKLLAPHLYQLLQQITEKWSRGKSLAYFALSFSLEEMGKNITTAALNFRSFVLSQFGFCRKKYKVQHNQTSKRYNCPPMMHHLAVPMFAESLDMFSWSKPQRSFAFLFADKEVTTYSTDWFSYDECKNKMYSYHHVESVEAEWCWWGCCQWRHSLTARDITTPVQSQGGENAPLSQSRPVKELA